MNKRVLHADGTVGVVAAGFSIEAERMSLQARGVDCRIVDLSALKDQPERITTARIEALARVRQRHNARLRELDLQQVLAFAGYHPKGRTAAEVETEKKRLRDLPATIGSRGDLDAKDADELDAYLPPELADD